MDTQVPPLPETATSRLHEAFRALRDDLSKEIVGQSALIERLLIALLADGHLLVEGAPGLAKTTAIRALAARLQADFARVQFTPDLLPADLTGTEVWRPQEGRFEFQAGPIFHPLLLADEINRAPAKVQSALLEAMGERQVTVGRHTYPLPPLFLVMAVPVGLLVVRYKGPLAIWAERLPYLLHALPGLVIALALVYFALHFVPALYQTSALLLIAYALLFLPLAQAPIRTALNKAAPQLEEAARTLGATSFSAFCRVTLPIIFPALGAAFALVFLDAMKELTATLLLSPTGLNTLATQVWSHTSNIEFAAAAPYAALLILVSGLPVYLLTTRMYLSR